MAQPISNDDRKRLEESLAAALLLLYKGQMRTTLDRLGLLWYDATVSPEALARINAFAAERAALIQSGINQRLDAAETEDDPAAATTQATREIDHYNNTTLDAFLASWAIHQARIDTMEAAPDPNGTDTSAAAATDWIWTRNTDNPPEDECQDAADASPASLKELQSLAGVDAPPAHTNCQCSLDPA